MKCLIRICLLTSTVLLQSASALSQQWRALGWNDSLTYESIEQSFRRDKEYHGFSDSSREVKHFKRFEYFWKGRTNSSDDTKRGKLNSYVRNLRSFYETGPICSGNVNPSPWALLGPVTTPAPAGSSNYTVGQHTMGIIWSMWATPGVSPVTEVLAGTNSSGLWKGTAGNGGWTWQCLTDNLRMPGMGVGSIAVDQIGRIFIGSTMGYERGYAAGVWMSEDNGASWNNLPDISPDTENNSVSDIKIFGDNIYIVLARKILKASLSSNLLEQDVFVDISPIPGQGAHGRYVEIEQFNGAEESILVLASESKGGRTGGGLCLISEDGGSNWTNLTPSFSTMNVPYIVDLSTPLAFIEYNNSDPNQWHLNNPDNITFNPATSDATAMIAFNQPNAGPGLIHQGTYDLVMNFIKDSNATLRIYTQDGLATDPIQLDEDRLLCEIINGTGGSVSIPVEVVGYPRRLVIVASYAGQAITGVQIDELYLQTDAMESFRVEVVNDLTSSHSGIYVASYPPSTAAPLPSEPLKVYRMNEIGLPFNLIHSVPMDLRAGYGENGGQFKVSKNGNIYIGGPNGTRGHLKIVGASGS